MKTSEMIKSLQMYKTELHLHIESMFLGDKLPYYFITYVAQEALGLYLVLIFNV